MGRREFVQVQIAKKLKGSVNIAINQAVSNGGFRVNFVRVIICKNNELDLSRTCETLIFILCIRCALLLIRLLPLPSQCSTRVSSKILDSLYDICYQISPVQLG